MGYERLEETADPELAINRALKTYVQKGYSPEWVSQRVKSIEIRKALTDEWEEQSIYPLFSSTFAVFSLLKISRNGSIWAQLNKQKVA